MLPVEAQRPVSAKPAVPAKKQAVSSRRGPPIFLQSLP